MSTHTNRHRQSQSRRQSHVTKNRNHRQSQGAVDSNHNYDDEADVEIDNFQLDSEVAEKLVTLQGNQKVAFLSGCERQYYPEQPGHNKFALEFQAHLADPTLPAPEYYRSPFDDRLNKPISKKGYGIGGLLGPRFAPLHGQEVPAPNQYQAQVKEVLTRQHRFPPSVWMNYGLIQPGDKIWDEKVSRKLFTLWGKCHQINVAFGTSTKEPRFGKVPKWNLTGPGNYTIRQLKVDSPRVFNGFLGGPTVFNPSTKLHCSYGPKDRCLECDTELMGERDYYRARYRVNPIELKPTTIDIEDMEELNMLPDEEGQKMNAIKKKDEEMLQSKAKRVLLCRTCYCKALRGESRFWKTRAEVLWLFEKTRHCGYLHEHNGIPEFTLKASCYWTRRLAQKEAILSRHYPDKCEKRVIERKQRYQS